MRRRMAHSSNAYIRFFRVAFKTLSRIHISHPINTLTIEMTLLSEYFIFFHHYYNSRRGGVAGTLIM